MESSSESTIMGAMTEPDCRQQGDDHFINTPGAACPLVELLPSTCPRDKATALVRVHLRGGMESSASSLRRFGAIRRALVGDDGGRDEHRDRTEVTQGASVVLRSHNASEEVGIAHGIRRKLSELLTGRSEWRPHTFQNGETPWEGSKIPPNVLEAPQPSALHSSATGRIAKMVLDTVHLKSHSPVFPSFNVLGQEIGQSFK